MSKMPVHIEFHRVFHPSDFSEASFSAFAHALKVVVDTKASFTILHIGDSRGEDSWMDFPRVRRTLEKWNILPPDSPREAIPGLGLYIEKVVLPHGDPSRSIQHYLSRHPHDLIVLATHQYDGWDRWTHQTVAEPVFRGSAEMTLFVPLNTEGIVSVHTGAVHLQNIVIPVDRVPDPQFSIEGALALADALDCKGATATLLHIGAESDYPEFQLPSSDTLKWRRMAKCGVGDNVEQGILNAAAECNADLIVISTRGHHGFLDALRGSTTERIVRKAKCPVLAVPAYRPVVPIPSMMEDLAAGKLNAEFGL